MCKPIVCALYLAVFVGCGVPEPSSSVGNSEEALQPSPEIAPTGKGATPFSPFARPGSGGGSTSNGIFYHGGPVMTSGSAAYYIWYGNWSGNTAVGILTDLANSIGGSPYFNINSGYYQSSTTKLYVANSVAYGGSTTDNYSRGKSLSDSAIRGVVSDAITSARLPNDTNGVYFVMTSADVTATSGLARTAWPPSFRTSWKRARPTRSSMAGMTRGALKTPTSVRGHLARLARPLTAPQPT